MEKLENEIKSIMIKDLKKVNNAVLKVITYPTFGNFVIPTMVRKYSESFGTPFDVSLGFGVLNAVSYAILYRIAPETIPYVAATQISINLMDGIYEWIKSAKERSKK